MQRNTLAPQKKKFSVVLQEDAIKKLINNTLGEPTRATRFITAISSAVATNPALQECDSFTIINAGLVGEALNLSPSPQLGHFYMVPFKDNKNNRIVATFQLGYKGYLQLAMRSGQYRKINVVAIKDGELISFDPMNEEIEVKLIENDIEREKLATVGYYAMFEYLNGFRKAMYWSKAKMESHAIKYSKGYQAKKGYTFWEKDFDGMAYKTMLRQLISKWGIMSIDLQKAYESDMGAIQRDGSIDYVDNDVEKLVFDQPLVAEFEDTGEVIEEVEQPKPTAKTVKTQPKNLFDDLI